MDVPPHPHTGLQTVSWLFEGEVEQRGELVEQCLGAFGLVDRLHLEAELGAEVVGGVLLVLPGQREHALAHAIALNRVGGSDDRDLELQVNRTSRLRFATGSSAAGFDTFDADRSGDLAAYHGVEHKAIAAYEAEDEGADAADAAKEHDRCGSHLVAPMLASNVAGMLLLRQAIVADVRESGDAVFERFNGKKDGTIWYYAALVEAFRGFPNRMVGELEREVTELRRLAGTS
jgi:hypothetical protein